MNVPTILRDIDTNICVHHHPSLRNRASLQAAQATIRVRWNNGRSTLLPYGLFRPGGLRSSARCRGSILADPRELELQGNQGLSTGPIRAEQTISKPFSISTTWVPLALLTQRSAG